MRVYEQSVLVCVLYIFGCIFVKFVFCPCISWAVAGRNEARLHQVLSAAGRAVSADLSSVPVLLCDCGDSNSLIQMARRSRVLLNCVGPYR